MNVYDEEDKGREDQPRLTPFETLTKLILPALSLVASIVALLRDQRLLAWLLGAAFMVSLAMSFYPVIIPKIKRVRNRRRDDRRAREAVPTFLKLQRRFEYFVGYPSHHTDTLHEILLSDLCNRNVAALDLVHLLPAHIFTDLCYGIEHRMGREVATLDDLLDVIREVNMMVGWFCGYCTQPVFDRFPPELRSLLTDKARSSLEAFRERFVNFIDDYAEFLKDFDESLTKHVIQGSYFPRPKPL